MGYRERILDITLVEHNPPIEMLDWACVAAPALEAVDLDLGLRQQVIGQEAADRPGDASDENPHNSSFCRRGIIPHCQVACRKSQASGRAASDAFSICSDACDLLPVTCNLDERLLTNTALNERIVRYV
jgi:hypothetical protein